jgi:CTP:molybdopterin cytidylyltransferase MocA
MTSHSVVGLVLAAGEGRRLGMPKALVTDSQGLSWLARSVVTLRTAEVADVVVVVGADAERVAAAAPHEALVVEASDWAEGMGASLRRGLRAVSETAPDAAAVIVMLVDTPGVGPDVVRRLIGHAGPMALVRATYGGLLGHPVVLGRDHWEAVMASASGDQGARAYLAEHKAGTVECGDLADGLDIDTPEALEAWRGGHLKRT